MTVLVSTWSNGLFAIADGYTRAELPGRSVTGVTSDGNEGALAIVDANSLYQRAGDGQWNAIARGEFDLSCCVATKSGIYAGTQDAQMLRVRQDCTFERLAGFDHVEGRGQWYAGTAIVDGKVVGPPLGVRSLSVTCDHDALLANVHVGGIARSTDAGTTWGPTIDINDDVHEVCAHPTRPNIVAAAAATGLGVSRDGGVTWIIEQRGLHTSHCSAVAFAGDDILVSASDGPFAAQGAIYRRPVESDAPLTPIGGGLPQWLDGVTDTGNIAARGRFVAVTDGTGNLYFSQDTGRTWSRRADNMSAVNSVLILG